MAMDFQFPVNRVLAFGLDWFAGAVAVSNPKDLHETEKIRIEQGVSEQVSAVCCRGEGK